MNRAALRARSTLLSASRVAFVRPVGVSAARYTALVSSHSKRNSALLITGDMPFYHELQPHVRYLSSEGFLDEKEVEERVMNVLKAFEKVDENKVTSTSHFANDLGLDSLDAVEVVMAIEEEFVIEIPDAEAEKILTVEDAIKFITSHPQAQ